jgi:preprotein translocase SecE subunit
MGDIIKKGKQFIADTVSELKKCNWPAKNELMEATLLVIVSLAILVVFVAGVDGINRTLINWLTIK